MVDLSDAELAAALAAMDLELQQLEAELPDAADLAAALPCPEALGDALAAGDPGLREAAEALDRWIR